MKNLIASLVTLLILYPTPGSANPVPQELQNQQQQVLTNKDSFTRLQTSVVTVWSETGHGTGFIFDKSGLIMTNQHVIGPSEYIAVQFDAKRKVPAIVLASDPEKDVAILWINLKALPDATVAALAKIDSDKPTVGGGGKRLHNQKPFAPAQGDDNGSRE